jgi:translation initiation factor 2-alpha kinase 4
MDPTEESQTLEITALQSIYPDEFIQVPPPKAWKVRALFPDFQSSRSERLV